MYIYIPITFKKYFTQIWIVGMENITHIAASKPRAKKRFV